MLKVGAESPWQWGWLQGCLAPWPGTIQRVLSWLRERDVLLSPLRCSCPWDAAGGTLYPILTPWPCQPPCPLWGRTWLALCRPASLMEERTRVLVCGDTCVCRGAQEALAEQRAAARGMSPLPCRWRGEHGVKGCLTGEVLLAPGRWATPPLRSSPSLKEPVLDPASDTPCSALPFQDGAAGAGQPQGCSQHRIRGRCSPACATHWCQAGP